MVGTVPPPQPQHECNTRLTRRRAGKQWHAPKTAFRPKAGNSSYEKRNAQRVAMGAVKAKEREMKEEKESEKQVCQRCLSFFFGWLSEKKKQSKAFWSD